jgi:hypothetical protein
MSTTSHILIFLASAVLIGCAASYVYIAINDPVRLAMYSVFSRMRGRIPPSRRLQRIWILASGLGVGILLYGGFTFLFSLMPRSWRVQYETVQGLGILCAFIGTVSVWGGLERAAIKFDKLDTENEALRHSLDHVRKQIDQLEGCTARDQPPVAIARTLDDLDKETAIAWKPVIRDRFKKAPLPPMEIDDPRQEMIRYRLDVGPSDRLTKLIRQMLALS